MTVALPAWRQANQREKEEELVFRGRQYVRAVQLFQRRFAATYPPSVDVLVQQKFLRKKYKDPMVEDGEFEVLYQGSLVLFSGGTPDAAGCRGRGRARASGAARRPGVREPTFTFDSRSGAVTQGAAAGTGGRTAGRRPGRAKQEHGHVDPRLQRRHPLQRVAVRVRARPDGTGAGPARACGRAGGGAGGARRCRAAAAAGDGPGRPRRRPWGRRGTSRRPARSRRLALGRRHLTF